MSSWGGFVHETELALRVWHEVQISGVNFCGFSDCLVTFIHAYLQRLQNEMYDSQKIKIR